MIKKIKKLHFSYVPNAPGTMNAAGHNSLHKRANILVFNSSKAEAFSNEYSKIMLQD